MNSNKKIVHFCKKKQTNLKQLIDYQISCLSFQLYIRHVSVTNTKKTASN